MMLLLIGVGSVAMGAERIVPIITLLLEEEGPEPLRHALGASNCSVFMYEVCNVSDFDDPGEDDVFIPNYDVFYSLDGDPVTEGQDIAFSISLPQLGARQCADVDISIYVDAKGVGNYAILVTGYPLGFQTANRLTSETCTKT